MTRPLSEQVALVERRIELRRARTLRHWDEVRSDVQRGIRWAPLAGVVAMAWLGFTLARQRGSTPGIAGRPPGLASTPSLWATLAALAATAMRFALSSQGRALWSAWRDARAAKLNTVAR
jgi:hypothetical protein